MRVTQFLFPPKSPKIQSSDWCHKRVVIVFICLLWGQPITGLDSGEFWGQWNCCHHLHTKPPITSIFSVWSSLVKPLQLVLIMSITLISISTGPRCSCACSSTTRWGSGCGWTTPTAADSSTTSSPPSAPRYPPPPSHSSQSRRVRVQTLEQSATIYLVQVQGDSAGLGPELG